jgi:large subunit ribosomal protein L5
MHFLEYFYFKTFKYDLLNKFNYNKLKNLPKLKKIVLNFNCKSLQLKNLASSLLALKVITSKMGTLTLTKKPNILMKIRKGNPVGCKIVLRKHEMFNFLERLIVEAFSKTDYQYSKNTTNKTSLSFELNNTFNFKELEKNYYLFYDIPTLNVTIVYESHLKKEISFLKTSFKIK